ncbi:MAG: gamma-glutamyltransferase, partial [Hyphomicrobiales bacterium]|nr:gamma-glutamyltransferase [Hyphomicrobiales bacterium]
MSFRTALITVLLLGVPLFAQAETPAPILEEDARFHGIVAENGVVVSDEPIATAIGRAVLAGGGNAIDAAVAVGFTLAVTHPRAGNLGGG